MDFMVKNAKEYTLNIEVLEETIEARYLAESQSHPGAHYIVTRKGCLWDCTCPDYTKRGNTCKHIQRCIEVRQ